MHLLGKALFATAVGLGVAAIHPAPAAAQISIGVSINFAPPPLPIYDQPPIPAPDYLWAPGYWAWDPDFGDYYWVPGAWVAPPRPGLLWTPPWWGWSDGAYVFHDGYWGPQIGFYGGIVYGFGYDGVGYQGGYWNGPHFFYNRTINNVGVNITNVYSKTVVINRTAVSFNGPGGSGARPTPAQVTAGRMAHVPPTAAQTRQVHAAAAVPAFRASMNKGRPPVAATAHVAQFKGAGVVTNARPGGAYHPPANAGRPGGPANGARPNAPAAPPPGQAHGPALRSGAPPARGPGAGPGPTEPRPAAHAARPHTAPSFGGPEGGPPSHADRNFARPPAERAAPEGGPPPREFQQRQGPPDRGPGPGPGARPDRAAPPPHEAAPRSAPPPPHNNGGGGGDRDRHEPG